MDQSESKRPLSELSSEEFLGKCHDMKLMSDAEMDEMHEELLRRFDALFPGGGIQSYG